MVDNTIALNIKTPAPVDFTKFAQLRNLASQNALIEQQIQATQASLPGIAADAEIKRKAADFAKWKVDNVNSFIGPDGRPNIDNFVNSAARAGFLTEAQAVAGTDISQKAQLATTAKTDQERQAAQLSTMNSVLGHAATLLEALPEEKRPAALLQFADFADKTLPGAGAQLKASFGKPDEKTGVLGVDSTKVKGYRTATMTPLQQTEKAIAERQIGVSERDIALREAAQAKTFAAEAFTPEGRNANSPKSLAAVAWANANGYSVPEGTSLFDMHSKYPEVARAVVAAQTQNIVPAPVKAVALATEAEKGALLRDYDSAIESLGRVPESILGTRPGAIGSAAFRRLIETNPELAGLETAIQVHNANPLFKGDQILPGVQTVGEIKAKLSAGRKQIENAQVGQRAVQERKTFSGPATETPAAPQAKEKMVKMINPGDRRARVMDVPESQVDEALGAGWKKISGGK